MSKGKNINLENYNYDSKGPHLNSPFSIKALQSLGIEEKQLKTLSFDEYIKLNRDCLDISQDLQRERYNNYFQKHSELISKAKEKRKQLKSENEIELNSELANENKIYHCDLHQNSYSSNFINLRPKNNPNCEICNEYSKKYEKLKERMKLTIQLEIDREYGKKAKRKKQLEKSEKFETQVERYNNKLLESQDKMERELFLENERKRRNEIEERKKKEKKERDKYYKEMDKKGSEVKRNMEMINEAKLQKLRNKQKELELRDEKRKLQIEIFKKNHSKTLNDNYALKKDRVNKTLNDYDVKREEKNKKYYDIQQQKQEKQKKFEKTLLIERTQKFETLNK